MRFLKGEMCDAVNEDDRLYWAVLVWTGLQLGCSGLHWTVFGCTGLFWTALGCTGCTGLFWVVLDSPIDMTDFQKIYGSFGGQVENRAVF